MSTRQELTKDHFLNMAESAGLDITDTRHMDELYQYVSAMLPGLKGFHELDLSGVEPAMIYAPPRE